MQTRNRLMSLALALALTLSVGAVTAFADTTPPIGEATVGNIADFKAAMANEEVSKIIITADLDADGTDSIVASRDLTIEGGGKTINNGLYFGGNADTTITVSNLTVVATNPSTNWDPIISAGVLTQHTGNLILNNCDISVTESDSTSSDRTRVYGLFATNANVTATGTTFTATSTGASSDRFTYGAFVRPSDEGQGLNATGCTFEGQIGVGIQEDIDILDTAKFVLASNTYTDTLDIYLVDNNSVGIGGEGFGVAGPKVPSDPWLLQLLHAGHSVCLANADETKLERYTRTTREYYKGEDAVSMPQVIGTEATDWASEVIALPAPPAPPADRTESSEDNNVANKPETVDKVNDTVKALEDPANKLPAGVTTTVTASGDRVSTIPVALNSGSAGVGLSMFNSLGNAPANVGIKFTVQVGLAGGKMEVVVPGGFGKITEPGRIGYSMEFAEKADSNDEMLKAVKGESVTSTTAKIGGNHTLPVTATITVGTKVASGTTVNIYKYDPAIRKFVVVGKAVAKDGKLTFATKIMGEMLFTTGTI